MDYLDRVFGLLEASSDLGVRVLDNGTRLIGHVPHVAPEAWLHIIFAPLSLTQVAQVEHEIATSLPEPFGDFLRRSNGLSLFSDSLSIHGLRSSYARSGDAVWQPFSIVTPNVPERPRSAGPSLVFVGSYASDGS